jgi:hypothetical protein
MEEKMKESGEGERDLAVSASAAVALVVSVVNEAAVVS